MALFLTLFVTVCNGQTKLTIHNSEKIKEQGKIATLLLIQNDFDGFCEYTYPKIIEKMGGKRKMIEILQKESQEMESKGISLLNATVGEPSPIITTKTEQQCTIPETIEMKLPNGKLVTQSTLIAISNNSGKNWYFVDTSGKDIHALRKILPNLSTKLLIPESQKPVFYSN